MSYMIEQGTLNNDVATFLAACMTEAIKHIHSKGFVHRDIKPENCLVTTKGYLKVADLGEDFLNNNNKNNNKMHGHLP